jgi:hypothetical protein
MVTSVALVLINVGLAMLIVAAIGAASFAPLWVGGLLLAAGVLTAIGAVLVWRSYVRALSTH